MKRNFDKNKELIDFFIFVNAKEIRFARPSFGFIKIKLAKIRFFWAFYDFSDSSFARYRNDFRRVIGLLGQWRVFQNKPVAR